MSKKFKGVLTRRVLRHRQAVAPRHLDSHQERKSSIPHFQQHLLGRTKFNGLWNNF